MGPWPQAWRDAEEGLPGARGCRGWRREVAGGKVHDALHTPLAGVGRLAPGVGGGWAVWEGEDRTAKTAASVLAVGTRVGGRGVAVFS